MAVRLKLVEGPGAGTIYFLSDGESKVFGRSASADVHIVDPLLSRHHALIRASPSGGVLLDLDSSNGTFLNGRLVKEAPLESQDRIKIGSIVLEVALEGRPGAPEPGDKVETARALVFCSRCHRAVCLGERQTLPWQAYVCDECKRRGAATVDPEIVEGWRLAAKVGEDAHGPIYRAEHATLDRKALVRIFAPSSGTVDSRALELFHREAAIAGRLSHPGIVETIGAGERNGVYYIVEEWIEGGDLEARLRGLRPPVGMPVDAVLHVGSKVAAALEYAFAQGLVHRNVRPQSIFLGEYDVVKLGDFGLAKTLSGAASQSGITKVTEWKGQANYLPPEQLITAATVDQRADVYSLGATLYHMVTGERPFEAPTAMRVVRRIGEGDLTPIEALAPDTPKGLRAVIERCMEREPARRFQTPQELAAALEQCRAKLGLPAR